MNQPSNISEAARRAYPSPHPSAPEPGMTMRQFYKAAALQGLCACGGQRPVDDFIRDAAKLADAMLAEDLKHEKGEGV